MNGLTPFKKRKRDIAHRELTSASARPCYSLQLSLASRISAGGYFKFPGTSHLMFYRLTPDAIEFMRTLHRRMDVERHV
jgi:hypothetical protein